MRSTPQEPEAKATFSVNTLKQLAAALQAIPSASVFEAEVLKEERAAIAAAAPTPAAAPAGPPADFAAQVTALQRQRDELSKKEKELKAWEARLRDREQSLEMRESILAEQEANAALALQKQSAAPAITMQELLALLPQPTLAPPPPPPAEP